MVPIAAGQRAASSRGFQAAPMRSFSLISEPSSASSEVERSASWVSPMESWSMGDISMEEEDEAEEDFNELAELVRRVRGQPDLQLGATLSRLGVKSVSGLKDVTVHDLTGHGISPGAASEFLQAVQQATAE
uniref:Uncharacterized protein n=1 Tax=Alexandrium andersonii TaxID=327968 RepID=A0A7S2H3H6_9DINO